MEIISIKDVLDFIDCGIVNNNFTSNCVVYMGMIHNFLLNSGKINEEVMFPSLKQTNLLIENFFCYNNEELKMMVRS